MEEIGDLRSLLPASAIYPPRLSRCDSFSSSLRATKVLIRGLKEVFSKLYALQRPSEIESLESRISELKAGRHRENGTELEEMMSIWMSIKKLKKSRDFSEKSQMEALTTNFVSALRFFAGDRVQLETPSDCLFREVCIALLREVDGGMWFIDIPTDKLRKESIVSDTKRALLNPSPLEHNQVVDIKESVDMGAKLAHKMYSEDNRTPLLPAEDNDNQERVMEDLSNFAFLSLMLSYGVLYFMYSAVAGKEGDGRLMMGLHVWTIILIFLLFICSCMRCSVRSLKIVRFVMAGLIFVSVCVVFVLLRLTL